MISCAASTLVAGVLGAPLTEIARTAASVHYATGDQEVPVLCVALPDAVRLPNSVVVGALPEARPESSPWLQVTRWWRPARPRGLTVPDPGRLAGLAHTSYDDLSPTALVGSGPGLTPSGDDVLAGALVTANATGDPRLDRWRTQTRQALRERRTTAVSRGLLGHAADGYAIPELADFVTTLCRGTDVAVAERRLRAVGGTSGDALVDGVVHVLATVPLDRRGAA